MRNLNEVIMRGGSVSTAVPDDHGDSLGATYNLIAAFRFIKYSGMIFLIPEY
jgi:hypothetical protein